MSFFLRLKPLCGISTGGRNLLKLDARKICTTATNSLQARRHNVSASVEEKLRQTDVIPENYYLIYRAPMESYMKWTNNVSTASALIIATIAGYKWIFVTKIIPLTYELNIGGLVSQDSDIWWFAGGFVLLNIAMRVFVAKYPLRIYRNEDKYLAVYDSQLPLRTKKYGFDRGDVAMVKQHLNPLSHCMFRLGNRTSLLLIEYFKTPSEFNQMFGLK